MIARLRLDHTALNGTLYVMGKSDSDKCGSCGVKEHVEHILLHCDIYKAEREKLKDKVIEAERECVWYSGNRRRGSYQKGTVYLSE